MTLAQMEIELQFQTLQCSHATLHLPETHFVINTNLVIYTKYQPCQADWSTKKDHWGEVNLHFVHSVYPQMRNLPKHVRYNLKRWASLIRIDLTKQNVLDLVSIWVYSFGSSFLVVHSKKSSFYIASKWNFLAVESSFVCQVYPF